MIPCAEAVRRLWDYLDATVEGPDRDEVEQHLSRCRRCCAELEFAQELRRLLAASRVERMPDDVFRRLNRTLEELADDS